MSDEHEHDDGGHEIDKMPAGRLFNIVVLLGAITLGLCIGVIQLFNEQVRNIEGQRADEINETRQQYAVEMTEVAGGYGLYEIEKPQGDDKPPKITKRYFVPVDKARQQVLDDAKLLGSLRKAPASWLKDNPTGQQVKNWGGLPDAAAPNKPELKRPAPGKAPAKPKGPRDHRFSFAVSGEDLVLLGDVPSENISKTIEAAAKKTHFGDKVRNKLRVTNEDAKPGFEAAYTRGLKMVDLMNTGAVKFTGGKLSAKGFVPEAKKAQLDTLAKAEGGPPLGEMLVDTTEVADACDADFVKALGKKGIPFKGDGAELDAKATKVVAKLAEIAKRCPGTLIVEGHTDAQDDASAAKKISLQRASAVSSALVEQGVPKTRVRSKGFGQERPAASGKNARVEIRIAR